MSRVSYAMMHPEGAGEMTAAVRKALNGLLAQLAMSAGIKRDEILELAIVGNPIMHHLLLGIDPIPLGSAPFALATDRAVRVRAAELELTDASRRPRLRPAVHRRPRRGRHGRASSSPRRPTESEVVELVVDVGTNAEIVLGNRDFLLAASIADRARRSRAPRSAAASGPRPARSSASGSTGRPSSRASGSSAPSSGRTSPGFAEATADDRRHRHLRLGHRRGHRRAVPRRRHHPGRDRRRLAGRPHAADRRPTAGRSRTSSTTARARAGRGSRSPRTTSGRSSSRRPRSTPASGC